MSLATLKADVRYQDATRELDRTPLNLEDPAFMDGRVGDKRCAIVERMLALAVEHGWDADEKGWPRT